jgi:hypothetical protein
MVLGLESYLGDKQVLKFLLYQLHYMHTIGKENQQWLVAVDCS